jgi:hypothetical protein
MLLGLLGVPGVGTAAAGGLVLFFACAVHTHLLAGDRSPQSGLEGALPTERERCGNPMLLRRPERTLCAQCEPHVPGSRSYLASLPPA